MEYFEEVLGGFSMLAGILLFLYRGKRKFDRTNAAGIEQFSSYRGKLGARLGDMALLIFSGFTFLLGVLLLALKYQDTWGSYVLGLFLLTLIALMLLPRK